MKDFSYKLIPLDIVKANSERTTYEYRHGEIAVGEIPKDIQVPHGVSLTFLDYGVMWEYKERTPVVIKRDGAYCREDDAGEDARQQAYRALSVFADKGYVSGWEKK